MLYKFREALPKPKGKLDGWLPSIWCFHQARTSSVAQGYDEIVLVTLLSVFSWAVWVSKTLSKGRQKVVPGAAGGLQKFFPLPTLNWSKKDSADKKNIDEERMKLILPRYTHMRIARGRVRSRRRSDRSNNESQDAPKDAPKQRGFGNPQHPALEKQRNHEVP